MNQKPSEKSARAVEREAAIYKESAIFLRQCIATSPNNYIRHILESKLKSIEDEVEAIPSWPIFVDATIIGIKTRETLNVPVGARYQNGRWTRYNWVRESFARRLHLNIESPVEVPDDWRDDETIPTIGTASFAVEIQGCYVPGVWANVAPEDELEYDITIDTPSLRTHGITFKNCNVDVSQFDPNLYL